VKAANEANLQATNTRHGYTGHEHLDKFALINMNGRVYDPIIGRFLSPDPYIQLPYFAQNFDRYSYVWNNPLKYVDPSGYKSITRWFYYHVKLYIARTSASGIWDDPFDDPLSSGGDLYDYGTSGGGAGGGAPLGGSAASGPGSGGGGAAPLNLGGDGGPGNTGNNRKTTTAGTPLNRPKTTPQKRNYTQELQNNPPSNTSGSLGQEPYKENVLKQMDDALDGSKHNNDMPLVRNAVNAFPPTMLVRNGTIIFTGNDPFQPLGKQEKSGFDRWGWPIISIMTLGADLPVQILIQVITNE
jgi:RHS repeat-associated protein